MMHMLTAIPPIPTSVASSDVMFWVMIGLLIALFLVDTTLWVIGSRRIAQEESQLKKARQQYEPAPV
jgi:hypothetical protein